MLLNRFVQRPFLTRHVTKMCQPSILSRGIIAAPPSSHNICNTMPPLLLQSHSYRWTSSKPLNEPSSVTNEVPSIPHFKASLTQHALPDTDENKKKKKRAPFWENPIPHQIYTEEDVHSIEKTHHKAACLSDRVALFAVTALRKSFDIISRYRGPGGEMKKSDWLHRCLFLETVAGVPGMVAGMCRHLRSLRTLKRDHGWIHTLLEEAENERMHLLIFMNMKSPNFAFRALVLIGQGVFFNLFFFTYLVSPTTCHRFVGYLEEEAVKTYTGLLADIDDGNLSPWESEVAPLIARKYYHLADDATVRDMVLCIRADEANHRDVNHQFASLDYDKGINPYVLQGHKKPESK